VDFKRPHPMRSLSVSLAGAALALALPALQAREPLYGVLDQSDLLNCETQFWTGKGQSAETCYRALANRAPSAAILAEALWALGDLQGANTAFQQAVNTEPKNALLRVRWGELYMQTYQYGEAANLFNEALGIEAENPWANLGAAQALSHGNSEPEQINALMAAVMDKPASPAGVRYRGLLMLVHNALEKDQFEQAQEAIADARKVAEAAKLSQIELYALEAAQAFMTLQPHQTFIDKALAENPAYGDAWAIPGYYAMITRRYRESGGFYEKAVAIEPKHWQAHLELGQNFLRMNQVTQGVDHIRTSFAGDKFNPTTINLMRMLEVFVNKMEVFNFPDPPQGPFPELIVRLNKSQSAVLKDYVRELTEASMQNYQQRYRFKAKEPVVIEVYPNHEDFVVRSVGMPGVGLLGVTFGYLLAMDSPTAHPRGESYHWGTTLWHEMAHVYTVEASNHLVPRWYTEGIAVYEEWRTGPIPGRKIPLDVYGAMKEGKFVSIAKLDDGFMRPTYENQVIVSYMQGGLVMDFIAEKFGFEKIVDMLYLFRDGVKLPEAVQQTLAISIDDFDSQFEDFIERDYGTLLKQLPTWQQQQKAAFEALEAENWQAAVESAKQAVALFPDYVEADSPYIALARAYSRLEDKENEFQTLQAFWQKGGYAPRALLALADEYIQHDNSEQAFAVLKDVVWSDPFAQDLHTKLGDLYLTHNEPAKALREFQVLLALDPADKAHANLKIATAYKDLNDKDKSMQFLMTALDIAPQYREAQALLLELSRSSAAKTNN
jgi:cellulose synthase operon protein C